MAELPVECEWGCKHDSQAMIPLALQASARVPHMFDLADAAYDAEPIRSACAELGTVAVIDANTRRAAETRPMSELEREIYRDRGTAERFFSHLLKSHGGRTVRAREGRPPSAAGDDRRRRRADAPHGLLTARAQKWA